MMSLSVHNRPRLRPAKPRLSSNINCIDVHSHVSANRKDPYAQGKQRKSERDQGENPTVIHTYIHFAVYSKLFILFCVSLFGSFGL